MDSLEALAGHYAPPRKASRLPGGPGHVDILSGFGHGLRPGEEIRPVKFPSLADRIDEALPYPFGTGEPEPMSGRSTSLKKQSSPKPKTSRKGKKV